MNPPKANKERRKAKKQKKKLPDQALDPGQQCHCSKTLSLGPSESYYS